MMALDFQSVSQIVASRGLNTFLEGLALAGLSWGVLRVFGTRSSMTRFAMWFSTLLVIAGLPLLSWTTSPLLTSRSHIPAVTLSGNWAAALFAAWALVALWQWRKSNVRTEKWEVRGGKLEAGWKSGVEGVGG